MYLKPDFRQNPKTVVGAKRRAASPTHNHLNHTSLTLRGVRALR